MRTTSLHHESGAELRYAVAGEGGAHLLALHGAYSTRDEIAAVLEPMLAPRALRRIYPDLPGMGDSPAHDAIASSNDVVDLLEALIDREVGAAPLVVVGHSYGAHLARGLAARRPRQVAGLALLCPVVPGAAHPAPQAVARSRGAPETIVGAAHWNDYAAYFALHTPESARRFRDVVAPLSGRYDRAAVERITAKLSLTPDVDAARFTGPALVLTARHDAFVGFRDQMALVDALPRGTHALVADAGHALPHEHPELVEHLLRRWLSESGC